MAFVVSGSLVSCQPTARSCRSQPASSSIGAMRSASSIDRPGPAGLLMKSMGDHRTTMGKSGPTTARVPRMTSSVSLTRFSRLPPYSSVRLFVANAMKRDRMPPTPAMTSMASNPASLHTRAALKNCCLNASICSSDMARKPPMNLRMAMSEGP